MKMFGKVVLGTVALIAAVAILGANNVQVPAPTKLTEAQRLLSLQQDLCLLNIKRGLKDPDSYQQISTAFGPTEGSKTYTVEYKYRAKNSFGTYSVKTTQCYFLGETQVGIDSN